MYLHFAAEGNEAPDGCFTLPTKPAPSEPPATAHCLGETTRSWHGAIKQVSGGLALMAACLLKAE